MIRLQSLELPPRRRQVVEQVQVTLLALVAEDVLEAVKVRLKKRYC